MSTTVYGRALRLEPSPTPPTQTEDQVWAAVEQELGPLTDEQRSHTMIRYGLLTWWLNSSWGYAPVGSVPTTRRVPVWMVTNCVDAPPPKSGSNIRPDARGALDLFLRTRQLPVVGDSPTNDLVEFGYFYEWVGKGKKPSTHRYASGGFGGPAADATPYFSARWHIVRHLRGNQVLVRYRPKQCYTLDHIEGLDWSGHSTTIGVILSGTEDGTCPAPSGTQPFTKFRIAPRFHTVHHSATGPASFDPVRVSSSGG